MRSTCRRHSVVSCVAVLAWSVVALLAFVVRPGAGDFLRLPFFVSLGVAMNSTVLAGMPWMMRGFIREQTLAYVAGYMHREADEPQEQPRRLEVVR